MKNIRSQLLECFQTGIARVRGDTAVESFLRDRALHDPVHLVAIGKAATAMALGVCTAMTQHIKDGLIITKHDHLVPVLLDDPRFQCIESDHPIPGHNTIKAGKQLLAYLRKHANTGENFLFLLSGGASSLVEVLPEGMALDDLSVLNRELLATGLNIEQMNDLRRALSQIKAGRLVRFLQGCPTLSLLISDVPGDDPAVIGSGLLTQAKSNINRSVYSATLLNLLDRYAVPIDLQARDFSNVEVHIIACLDDAKQAVAKKARALGLRAQVMPQFLSGDAEAVAQDIVAKAKKTAQTVLIYGGETQVNLPPHPGLGGRNQHLALSAAIALQGSTGICVLAGGTDGTDGLSTAAGGVVDGGTVERGAAAGWSALESLAKADSGNFLEAAKDILITGPTGTNVMDLVLAYNAQD